MHVNQGNNLESQILGNQHRKIRLAVKLCVLQTLWSKCCLYISVVSAGGKNLADARVWVEEVETEVLNRSVAHRNLYFTSSKSLFVSLLV